MIVQVTVIAVPAADAELAADRLMTAGAFAVEERVGARPGTVEVVGAIGDTYDVASGRLGAMPDGWHMWIEEVDATPLDTWREFAEPVFVADDLVLRPAWSAPLARPGLTEIAVEPAAAFGLGDHPTTRLSAASVWRLVRHGARVLDVGCGTGVLAIVAVQRGAAEAVAIDIAEPAVPATRDNAARNGVAARIQVSTTPLADIDDTFDLVVANILAPALIALAADLRRVTAPDGRLVISGILADRHEHVLAALDPMVVERSDTLDGWAAVELRHRG